MNFLAFWITAMVIISSSVAEEELPSDNQLLNVEEDADGRSCNDCHGGDAYQNAHEQQSTSQVQHYGNNMDLSWLWGLGGMALTVLPILAVNIAGVVLLAILLKQVGGIGDTGGPALYQPAYAYSTYQAYDGGAANGFGPAPGPAVGVGGGGGGGYSKRSTDQQAKSLEDHSTLQFITNLVGEAIHKYSNLNAEE